MKRKNLFALALATLLSVSMSDIVFAAEIMSTSEILPIVDTQTTSDGRTRVSWGKGILHATNPTKGNPYAYAETQTYAGTAYQLTAQTVAIVADSITYETSVRSLNNATTVNSATLLSPTKKVFFIGKHSIKDKSNSTPQTCTTSVDYKS